MRILLQQISALPYVCTGPSLEASSIQEANETLKIAKRPLLPDVVKSFLQKYNGIMQEDGVVWGIDDDKHAIYDVVAENLLAENPYPHDILLLGENSITYIAWQISVQSFIMLDKSSFDELHRFNNFAEAVSYILKIIRPM